MKIETLYEYEQYGLQVTKKEYFFEKDTLKYAISTEKETLVLYFSGKEINDEVIVDYPVVNEYFSQIPLPMIYNDNQLEIHLNLLVELQAYLQGDSVILNHNVPIPDLTGCNSLYDITEMLKGFLFVRSMTYETFAQTLYNRNQDKYIHFYLDMDGYYHGNETNEDKLPIETLEWDCSSYIFKNGENFKPHHYSITIGEADYEFVYSTTGQGDTSSHFPVKVKRGDETSYIDDLKTLLVTLRKEFLQISDTAKESKMSWPAHNYIRRWDKTMQHRYRIEESPEDDMPY